MIQLPTDTVNVEITLVTAAGVLMTKRLWRDKDGSLAKAPAANPSDGVFSPVPISGNPFAILTAYAGFLDMLGPDQAPVMAPLPAPLAPDGELWRLTVMERPRPCALSRSGSVFRLPAGIALVTLDFDIPAALRARYPTPEIFLREVLLPAWPGFADAALLIKASVSAGGKLIGGPPPLPGGYHVSLVLSSGVGLTAFATAIFDRLAAAGFATIEISRKGVAMRRALIDLAAAKGGERLFFEADPVIGRGVEAVRRVPLVRPGGIVDVGQAVATMALDVESRIRLDLDWSRLLDEARPRMIEARTRWMSERGRDIAQREGVAIGEAMRRAEVELRGYDSGVMFGSCRITLDSGEVVTVDQILANPRRFRGARTYSIDEDHPRRGVGLIQPFWSRPDPKSGKPEGPWLHSFEHGGHYWMLRPGPRPAGEAITEFLAARQARRSTPLSASAIAAFEQWRNRA